MISELLERAGNDLLRFDPDTAGRLSRLQGKVFKLHVLGLDRVLYFVPGESGVMVRDRWPAQADITLTGPPLWTLPWAHLPPAWRQRHFTPWPTIVLEPFTLERA